MSPVLYIEIWNERFPDERTFADSGRSRSTRPDVAEFIGQVNLRVEMTDNLGRPAATSIIKTMTLENGAEGGVDLRGDMFQGKSDEERSRLIEVEKARQKKVKDGLAKRGVTGTITFQYEWTPMSGAVAGISLADSDPNAVVAYYPQGSLKVTVISAESLLNLEYRNGKKSGSNPYCRVFCYPNSPADGVKLCPCGWRSPLIVGTLTPKWNAHHAFDFRWTEPPKALEEEDGQDQQAETEGRSDSGLGRDPNGNGRDGMFAGPPMSKKGMFSSLVHGLCRELSLLRQELRTLDNSVKPAPERGTS